MTSVDMNTVECVLDGAIALMQLTLERMESDLTVAKRHEKNVSDLIATAADTIYYPALNSTFVILLDLQNKIKATTAEVVA